MNRLLLYLLLCGILLLTACSTKEENAEAPASEAEVTSEKADTTEATEAI